MYGFVGRVAGIGILEDLGMLGCGGVVGFRTKREALVHLIALVVECFGMNMAIPFIG